MTSNLINAASARTAKKSWRGRVKCVVWDLDDTIWEGILLEGDRIRPRTEVIDVIRQLDRAGILHSVASKNDEEAAMEQLRSLGINHLFLYPRIGWNSKSDSIRQIAASFNIGLDAIAFVDDQEFELAEVAHSLPEVLCVNVAHLKRAVRQPEFQPRFITSESRHRRDLYRHQIARDSAEREFTGTSEEFLAGLDMAFTIAPAGPDDLQRAEELTVRTNQLNSTARIYSYEELDELRTSPRHLLLVASLSDRFGDYGTIGLTLVEKDSACWTLRLLLMSCRVVSRGVGTVMLNHVMRLARDADVELRADLVETGRNRMMQVAYAFAGFREVSRDGGKVVLRANLGAIQPPPGYVRLNVTSPRAEHTP